MTRMVLLGRGAAIALMGLAIVVSTQSAQARNEAIMFSVEDAMATADAKAKLDGSVKFYFGKTPHGKVLQSFGERVSNKKTNAFGKSDLASCNRAVLSALITFQERAKKDGGNAVINMVSYYKRNTVSNDTHFECHAGGFVTGVTLKGEVVRLEE